MTIKNITEKKMLNAARSALIQCFQHWPWRVRLSQLRQSRKTILFSRHAQTSIRDNVSFYLWKPTDFYNQTSDCFYECDCEWIKVLVHFCPLLLSYGFLQSDLRWFLWVWFWMNYTFSTFLPVASVFPIRSPNCYSI